MKDLRHSRMFVLLVTIASMQTQLWAQQVTRVPVAPVQSVAEQFLFSAANGDREAHGLAPLRVEMRLVQAATLHAREMASHAAISHQFPGEPELAARASSAGVHFSLVTENVAESPNPGGIHELWMHSAGHRANLLDPQVDAVGIAVVSRGGQFYAVEDFARTVPSLSFNEQEKTVARLIETSGVTVAPTTAEARTTCTLDTGYAGARRPGFVMRFTAADLTRLPEQLQTRLASGRYHEAVVAACALDQATPFSGYAVAVMLYP
jgi:uncharacterized protein YkwD